ncbi:MAG: C13 family peptidase [Arenimonas sp.]
MNLAWLSDSFRLFGQGLSFCFLRAPKSRTPITGFTSFGLIAFFFTGLLTVSSYLKAGEEPFFVESAYGGYALLLMALLAASALAANIIGRQSLWLSLATITLVTTSIWTLLLIVSSFDIPVYEVPTSGTAKLVFGIIVLCILRIYMHFMQPRNAMRIIAASLLTMSLSFWPWTQSLQQTIFFGMPSEEEFAAEFEMADKIEHFDSEAVFSIQANLLQKQLASISAQNPDKIDLYVIGVAGDGNERVFRNEVEYLQKLLPSRLDAKYLPLVNTLENGENNTIASFTNLKNALQGLSGKMDREQDILLVYLTSHGSKDHKFILQLGDLPLAQITPGELDSALVASGIKHQIIIVSACYSGGFIEPLRNENRLIITAARKDRTSFGCGADSEITWFGKAFWVEAMNEHNDFEQAFMQAKNKIASWETKADYTASEPQISMGKEMQTHLQIWQKQLPTNRPKLPFFITLKSRVEESRAKESRAEESRAEARPTAPLPAKDTAGSR